MKDNELIVCRDVSLGYEGRSVLTGLNLTISKGDYLCVVGDNGSGKSTLMRGLWGCFSRSPALLNTRRRCGTAPSATCPSRPAPSGTFPPRCWRWFSPAV